MATTIKVPIEGFAFLNYYAQGANDHTSSPVRLQKDYDYLLLKFKTPTDGSEYKRVISNSSYLYTYIQDASGASDADYDSYYKLYPCAVFGEFDVTNVTYATRPEIIVLSTFVEYNIKNIPFWRRSSLAFSVERMKKGIAWRIQTGSSPAWVEFATSGSNAPYASVSLDDSYICPLEIQSVSPDSGSVVKTTENVFSWGLKDPGVCLADLKQTSAVFRWRSGTSGTIHTINVSGNSQSVTVPANTFAGTTSIQWQVAVTANSGVVTTSKWVTLSTADATPTAAPLSPVDTVIDGSKDVLFQWQHSISTGTAQSKADLQKSTDGSTWQTLATVTGAARQWTCPAGTLTSSIKYWRVRTYNADGIASAWSDAAQIVVIAAPTAPSIQIKSTGPRPSISWQTSEQEAYQVKLDGKLSGGTHYGTDKTWTSPAYLADGSHTVRVRVQNQYGMWSDWGAAALPVTNTPGAAITLTVQASSVADLSWQTSGSYDFYLVYRNGKPIAKLTQTQYTDELSSGSTTYQVRGCYADSSNYGLSSAVTVTITTGQYVTLYGIASGKKVTLKHCGLKNQPVQNAINRDIQYIFMYGSTYPHAERSEFVTKKVGGTAVFLPGEDKAGFDALIGELVCLKTQSGEMVIGYLNETSDTSRVDPDKSVVNFSIQQIDYAEVIDIDS